MVRPAGAASPCADLVSGGQLLAREEPNLGPPGAQGPPGLCLLYHPAEAMHTAVILPVETAEQFRGAKADALRRLSGSGFDACTIGTWQAWGVIAADARFVPEDFLDVPGICPPRVLAADGTAATLLDGVRAALDAVIERTADELGWQPHRPLTVIVVTEAAAALDLYQRYSEPREEAEPRARAGRSLATSGGIAFGSLIVLNGVGREPAHLVGELVHEYTHIAQAGIGAQFRDVPHWFLEGQALYQETRYAAGDASYRALAVERARAGATIPLAVLAEPESWCARERLDGVAAMYATGYAAVAYLVEHYGFPTTVRLLRENRHHSIAHFHVLLATLTGGGLDALDAAVRAWLLRGS